MKDGGVSPSPVNTSNLRWAWNLIQLGALLLPLMPALAEVALVLSFTITWQQQYRRLLKFPLNHGFLLLSFWLILTSCLAFKPTEAFLGLANFLPFIGLLTACRVLIEKPYQLRQLAWIIVIPSLAVVVLGLGQLLWGWVSPQFFLTIFGWELVAKGNPSGRMASVFMYANILAAYLLIVFTLALGLWLDTYQTWRQFNQQRQGWLLGFLSLVVLGDGIGLILTSSRNAWAIAILSCLAFALYLGWRWLVLGVTTITGILLWASFGFLPGREWLRRIIPAYFWARLSDELYPNRPVATLRSTQWQFAWNMFRQRPLQGWGLRNFTPLYEAKMGLWLGHPHNLFLMLMAEVGMIGTVLFCGLVGWILAQASLLLNTLSKVSFQEIKSQWKSNQFILFTYLVAFGSCTLFNLFDITIFDLRVNTLGWLLLSAIYGIVYSSSHTNEVRKSWF